jgi:hypothetical protein
VNDNFDHWFTAALIAVVLLAIAFWVGVVIVAVHFLGKVW